MSTRNSVRYAIVLAVVGLSLAACQLSIPNPAQSGVTRFRTQAIMNTFYASPSGSGSACSSGAPCSLTGARDRVRGSNGGMSGDIVVWVSDGTYNLASSLVLTGQDSGSNGYNVIWKASGSNAVLSGGQDITGWAVFNSSQNIYRANVGTSLNTRQVFVNGTRATRARGAQNPGGWSLTSSGYNAPDALMSNWGNKSNIEIVNQKEWKSYRCSVDSISGNSVTMQNPCWNNAQLHGGFNMSGVSWIENALELLDTDGEWYLDRSAGFLYYKPRAGENMASVSVIAAKTETLLEIQGSLGVPAHHIQFVGLNFRHNTWLRPSTAEGYADLQSGWHYTGAGRTAFSNGDLSRTPGAVTVSNASNIRFERNAFRQTGGVALDFPTGNQSSTIIGNTFDDLSSSAIQIGETTDVYLSAVSSDPRNRVSDMVISNNTITRVGQEFFDGVGIAAGYVSAARITHNDISQVPYTAISVGWGWGQQTNYPMQSNIISYNVVFDFMKELNDGGGIYVLSKQPDSTISNNYVQQMTAGKSGGGIYLDNGTQNYTVSSNLVLAVYKWAAVQDFGREAINNTLQGNYSDTTNISAWFAANTISDNTLVSSGNLPVAAQNIVACAGLEPAYGGTATCAGGLKAQWLMENSPNDSSSNGNNGTLNGSASYSTDARQGTASLSLNGSNGFLSAAGNLTIATDNLSLVAWVKWGGTTGGNQFILNNGNTGADGYGLFVHHNNNDYLTILVGGKAFVASSVKLIPATWTHVAAVRDTGLWKLYVAGNEVAISGGSTTAPNVPTDRTTVGANHAGTEPFFGLIDDARVYDKALTASEIRTLAPTILFSSGFETSDLQPTWVDTVDTWRANVGGFCCGSTAPETSIRSNETQRTGSGSLMYAGLDESASQSYAYLKVFDVNLPISSNTKLSYWIYPQYANATCVAIDMVFTDGSTLRDSGVRDQNNDSLHPNNRCGKATINVWNNVQANLGSLVGKTIDRILVGYDQSPNTGIYRGHIDDLEISNP